VKAGEQEPVGRGQGWIKEKGEEGSQQGREGSKQEGETRGEGEVTEGTGRFIITIQTLMWHFIQNVNIMHLYLVYSLFFVVNLAGD